MASIDVKIDELAIAADSRLVGCTIGDVELRGKGTFIVVALRQVDGATVIHPSQSMTLTAGDTLIIMGHRGDLPQFARVNALKRQMKYRGAKS